MNRVFALAFLAILCAAQNSACPAESQHPIVFTPGLFGSILEAKLDIPNEVSMPNIFCSKKTDDYEQVWIKVSDILPFGIDCLAYYIGRNWTTDSEATANTGVDVRVPRFGETYAMDSLDPGTLVENVITYWRDAFKQLRELGFQDNVTMFGAPYDWRLFPQETYYEMYRELVEKVVAATGKKAVLVTHSMGGLMVYQAIMTQSLEWRQKYIERFIPLSAPWAGSGLALFGIFAHDFLNLQGMLSVIGRAAHSWEGMYYLLPNFRSKEQVVVTVDGVNYTIDQLGDFINNGLGINYAGNAIARARKFHETAGNGDLQHPGIPVSLLWSNGQDTVQGISFNKQADVGKTLPGRINVDGDTFVTLESLEYAYNKWSADPEYGAITEKVFLENVFHGTTSHHEETIKLIYNYGCDATA